MWYNFLLFIMQKIINNVEPNKAPGNDIINIQMLKVWDPAMYKHLEIIYKCSLENGMLQNIWQNIWNFRRLQFNLTESVRIQTWRFLF